MRGKTAVMLSVALVGMGAIGSMIDCEDRTEAPSAELHHRARRERSFARTYGSAMPIAMPDGGTGDGAVTVAAGPCFSGIALDVWGHPIAGADVHVTLEEDGAYDARTDAEGRFEACGEGDLYVDVYDADGGWGRVFVEADDFIVEVFETAYVSGRVLGPDGAPFEGALVSIGGFEADEEGAPRPWSGEALTTIDATGREAWSSDANGRFEIPIAQARLFSVQARYPGYLTATAGPLAIRPGAHIEVELRFARGQRITGLVIGEGRGIAGASVRLRDTREGVRFANTDTDGRFVFDAVSAGRNRLTVDTLGYLLVERLVEPGEHTIELVPMVMLDVRVSVAHVLEGCPLNELSVRALVGDFEIGAAWIEDGVAHLDYLEAGVTHIVAHGRGVYGETTITTRPGDRETIELRLGLSEEYGILRVAPLGGEPGDVLVHAGHDYVYGRTDQTLCLTLPPGEQTILVSRQDGLSPMQGVATIARGRATDWAGPYEALPPLPPALPLEPRVEEQCDADLDIAWQDDRYLVVRAGPSEPHLWPGDRVESVGALRDDDGYVAIENGLYGPPGSEVTVTVVRGDRERITTVLVRDRCN